jgi:hypothetical protein
MSHKINPRGPEEPALTSDGGEGLPLADFPWSDGVVGIGYFPEEVGLPRTWSWRISATARRS